MKNSSLSAYTNSRDNNFNLLRFCAAAGVLISHTFLLSGSGFQSAALVLGYVSVNVFFIISGFLVYKSLLDRNKMSSFTRSRVLRIFPALIIAVLFTTYLVGLYFTSLPSNEYLLDDRSIEFVIKNIILVIPNIPDTLPGVFSQSPNSKLVNAPLWTLPYEIKMYILLGFTGGFLLIVRPSARKKKIFIIFITLLTIVSMVLFVTRYTLRADPIKLGIDYEYFRLFAMFGSGILLYNFRDKVKLSTKYFIFILILIAASSVVRPLFVATTYISLSYIVIYLAYIPIGFIRKFNKLGDYSYGIYIYAYPIQQSVEQLWPNLQVAIYFLVTFSLTLLLSILSWHLIEKKILSYKK